MLKQFVVQGNRNRSDCGSRPLYRTGSRCVATGPKIRNTNACVHRRHPTTAMNPDTGTCLDSELQRLSRRLDLLALAVEQSPFGVVVMNLKGEVE